jgi:hypothetical protein
MVSRTVIIASAMVIALLPIGSGAWGITSALATEAVSSEPLINSVVYHVHIPLLPTICCTNGYEFHVGIFSNDNSTFTKTTISYGCQIAEHKACFPPFVNRYVFYASFIQLSTLNRTQVPTSGYTLTPNTDYRISLSRAYCLQPPSHSIKLSISNSTKVFTMNVCNKNAQYDAVAAGLLEMHNVTKCSQLPSSGSFTQRDIIVNGNPSQPFNWNIVPTRPTINCGYALSFENNDVTISWNPSG